MSEATHTPGPLTVHKQHPEGTHVVGFHVVCVADGLATAYVACKEDAYLYAAATELLAACEAAEREMSECGHKYHGPVIKQLRAAIAKATT